ncbi:hypothetical protein CMQ_7494 [Grosmannia clavigera kw1407]|uniref:Uncharacterized protein n=1 Tax=Grosmannia clavigera (strain kw1407 / UAMH 11150) TaxID=655863 RepID=F0XNM6_GROCL|nr:uncharacterized protein CMQ_7494 [Grosmannia clavigera kw1407]EFX00492.1 hypothetical protein CMQ_7494 [Grosmannia clavigera kw1407]
MKFSVFTAVACFAANVFAAPAKRDVSAAVIAKLETTLNTAITETATIHADVKGLLNIGANVDVAANLSVLTSDLVVLNSTLTTVVSVLEGLGLTVDTEVDALVSAVGVTVVGLLAELLTDVTNLVDSLTVVADVTGDLSVAGLLATGASVVATVTATLSPLVVALGAVLKLAVCLPIVGHVLVGVVAVL